GASGTYQACAMKPRASPKWLFVPYADTFGGVSIKANIMEKDESDRVIFGIGAPHIFEMNMWKQSDLLRASVLGNPTDANSTYTFYIEGNYTIEGQDKWDAANLRLVIAAWYDWGEIGISSVPGDPTWTSATNRTRQFKLTYTPGSIPVMDYPTGAPNEFSVHSYYESSGHGPDGSHRRVYINVTFGPQTMFSPGDMPGGTVNPYYPITALNDNKTWDLNVTLCDASIPTAGNSTYGEFGVKKYASIRSSGTPTGSIPPGATQELNSSSNIWYSINSAYTLNVSIPNLIKDGNPLLRNITAANVQVNNTNPYANASNSEIYLWTTFSGPDQDRCIWGTPGTMIPAAGNGTVGMPEATQVRWRVTVPVSTPEGVYRATITITLWGDG
ncbi:MAG: hypothetical protein R6W91_02155, partial [Thermoplasmata archaeon]